MTTFTSQLGYTVPTSLQFKIAGKNDQGTGPFASPSSGSVQTQSIPIAAPVPTGSST
jgi:hypothetical protein